MKLYNSSVLGLAALVAGRSIDESSTMVDAPLDFYNPIEVSSMTPIQILDWEPPLSAKAQQKKDKKDAKDLRKAAMLNPEERRLKKEAKQKRRQGKTGCTDAADADGVFDRIVENGGFNKMNDCVAYKINPTPFDRETTYYDAWKSCKDDTEGIGSLAEFHTLDEYKFVENYYLTDEQTATCLENSINKGVHYCWIWIGATPMFHISTTDVAEMRQISWRWSDGSAVADAGFAMADLTNAWSGNAQDMALVIGDYRHNGIFNLAQGITTTKYNGYACEIRNRSDDCQQDIVVPRCRDNRYSQCRPVYDMGLLEGSLW